MKARNQYLGNTISLLNGLQYSNSSSAWSPGRRRDVTQTKTNRENARIGKNGVLFTILVLEPCMFGFWRGNISMWED